MMNTWLASTLAVVDTFLCIFIFFPLAILHWRGTWDIQDAYIVPQNPTASAWVGVAIGTVLSTLAYISPALLFGDSVWRRNALGRIHMYIQAWAVLCYWRGVWNLLDIYLGEGWINSFLIYCVCQILTLVTRTTRTNVGLPLSIQLDTHPDVLQPTTAFLVSPSDIFTYLLDAIFSQVFIVTSNVCIWRGIWNVFDATIYPSDPVTSELVSLALGYAGYILLFLLQRPTAALSAYLYDNHYMRTQLVFEDVVMVIATWINILLWRGGWDACVRYLMPGQKVVGGWTTHYAGAGSLLVLQLFNTVAMNGIERDGSYERGEGIYPTQYLREIFAEKLQGYTHPTDSVELEPIITEEKEEKIAIADLQNLDINGVCSRVI